MNIDNGNDDNDIKMRIIAITTTTIIIMIMEQNRPVVKRPLLKYRISLRNSRFVKCHKIFFRNQPFWNFTQSTTTLCVKLQNDLTTQTYIIGKRNFVGVYEHFRMGVISSVWHHPRNRNMERYLMGFHHDRVMISIDPCCPSEPRLSFRQVLILEHSVRFEVNQITLIPRLFDFLVASHARVSCQSISYNTY